MRIAVTGSSGLIGSALVTWLEAAGDDVIRLVRRVSRGPSEAHWDPEGAAIDASALEGCDAVVHLAGVGIGEKRWSEEQKRRILDSRVQGTTLLSETLAKLDRPPAVLVSASAVGYYGDRGDEELTEESSPGDGFLADVVRAWEASTGTAEEAGIRVVHCRSGIVLSASGGVIGRVLPLFKLGLAGKLGSGRQWWSWVTIDDEVGLIGHAIATPEVRGPFNATAPNPVTNVDFTRAIGAALHRPTVLSVPGFALAVAMGRGIATEMILAGQRALPVKALATGYEFRHAEIGAAARAVLGAAPPT